ncbi:MULTISPECIES: acyl-[ACP]--phospholipid O-acyltransferase [Methylobacterium]|jgi:acyl-[acyl-carrier-protein]-phospholipid O-acyltransferase/long-chain-fatty-acid--[acyl-carrier-protein] ligase|uniref:2-acyl-glycerophospho-ethanolamineacyltransferase n=2 Tax=Methylobacterium TaxID=407 RepID=A0A0C6F9X2_9HYPH|nr:MULTISPECIES: acyl-[ACP]--phospholipid O-acyltransferase [Methylobacterium]MBZ6411562.1 acyl-[ACP]--phospholipid O-acyltransferase [Methylobacterium sp.]MBK3395132.1 acyl-[ACP]--phospholipid O-acyltransferase [Methylobacterium ajmalii]MBK3412080.1 acyl-[ACP]--phospholipid O-acyltransferase [Methylobacterium ajmalii]MBK3423455.1 acyl-[ACP]--phospholipid O-acyltransferase [Methylobacterium ajmalii]SFE39250.1 acyl-[acyl-carrier-protein]-phospholipid O-acyltransferase / long-chain-fatty-acid--[
MSGSLMASRRFAPLFWCQFFSAFNDNFLKNALVFLIMFGAGGVGGGADGGSAALVTLAGAAFIAPFFFLSGLGGQLADRYDKAYVARRLKAAEILAAAVAVLGFWLSSVPILFVALVLFGIVAALFGPIKYGILPDHLARAELPAGNALIEAATFLAILTGTIAGGLAVTHGGAHAFGLLVMGFAGLCWLASLAIPTTGEAAPTLEVDRNVLRSTGSLMRDLYEDTRLWRTGLITSWFWLVGAVVLALLPALVKRTFGGDETVVTALLALFSIGVALGSGLASWLCAGRIVMLPTPIAALIMGLVSLDLALVASASVPPPSPVGALEFLGSWRGARIAVDFVVLAAAAGLFIVPSFAALQAWTPKERRARVIAASNVLAAAFIVLGAVSLAVLQKAGLSSAGQFLIVGIANLVAGVAVMAVLPTSGFRDFLSIVFRAFYRLEVRGLENIEKAGPNAIIALNHVSFLDAGLALSLTEREPTFAIDHTIAQKWWVKPFLWLTRALPLDPTKPMATRTLINAVKGGETLIIFPEGRLTVTGSLMKVYDGAGLIADKSGVPVVPVKIEGPERTAFSRLSRAQVRRRWWPKFIVTVLEPVRLEVDPALKGKARRQAAGAALYGVMSDLIFRTAPIDRTVFDAVVEAAEREGGARVALEDPVTGTLTYRRLLMGARVLGAKLGPLAPQGRAIGVMLPNANAAAVTVLGVMSAGRVPAMINFTAGPANILSACKAAEVETIVTSRAFVQKGRLDALLETLSQSLTIVYLEDVRSRVGRLDKLRGFLGWRQAIHPRKPEDPAAILFTSGSEGTPKGVVLSHRNMLANAAQAQARIDFGRTDKVFNVLPVFHSFGLTVGLVLPLVSGVPVYLYPSPLHYRIVPELVYGSNATILFGTDTFLAGYARVAHAYDFRSLRYILAGAEPVKPATRKAYAEKFGLRILEGYGVTETAPVLALNTPMFNRFGTVGRVMPGMEARLEPVPGVTEGGRLFVRGPNVMLGYLRAEKPGVLEAPAEGWHDTGDIVTIDADGFVTIRGRAKRFAKVGGEMISLAAVEAVAAELYPDAASAVAALPDARKGERLVLVTEKKDATRAAFQARARASGLSELAVPAEIVAVDALPQLGSGKVDFAAVTRLAAERTKPAEAAA